MAVVLEQHVAAAHRGDEQVRVAVVVDVRERRAHADAAGQSDTRLAGDVPELAAAQVLPQLVPAHLVRKVDVVQSVAVHVGDGDAVAVVVVNLFIRLAGVVDDAVDEGDSALLYAIGELELVKHLELVHRRELSLFPRGETRNTDIGIGIENPGSILICRDRKGHKSADVGSPGTGASKYTGCRMDTSSLGPA